MRRAENDQLLLGGWEPRPLSVDPRSFDWRASRRRLSRTSPRCGNSRLDFAPLFPAVAGAPWDRIGKGWPTFTPDGRFIIGPSRRVAVL